MYCCRTNHLIRYVREKTLLATKTFDLEVTKKNPTNELKHCLKFPGTSVEQTTTNEAVRFGRKTRVIPNRYP